MRGSLALARASRARRGQYYRSTMMRRRGPAIHAFHPRHEFPADTICFDKRPPRHQNVIAGRRSTGPSALFSRDGGRISRLPASWFWRARRPMMLVMIYSMLIGATIGRFTSSSKHGQHAATMRSMLPRPTYATAGVRVAAAGLATAIRPWA